MKINTFNIEEPYGGQRIDAVLSKLCPDYSRSKIQKWIEQGAVKINQNVATSKRTLVQEGDTIEMQTIEAEPIADQPQEIELEIIYQDDDLMVINKPAGLVVHPGAGVADNTLLNAILHLCPENKTLPQAGLIHRLDKDTTGLLLIAKHETCYLKLNQAMANREIQREYTALVKGCIMQGGTIDAPLARHPTQRLKFCIMPSGKHAVTHYMVKERLREHTLLNVKLETGRTHQIRVHMLSINHPIIGDKTYNRSKLIKQNVLNEHARHLLYHFPRQALHATSLTFNHPMCNKVIQLQAPMPKDFEELVTALKL